MVKYLNLFQNHDEYEDFVDGGTMMRPNVSHCINENDVHYNPKTLIDEYFTFVAMESGTFSFAPQSENLISYSTNNGNTWTEGNSVDVNSGDRVLWKGTMTPASNYGIGTFSSTANFEVRGNAMSLLYGDNFSRQESLSGKNYSFARLFYENTKLISAENLLLTATTLADQCYSYMFTNCTNLVTGPSILPATTLTLACYEIMFNNCTSLTRAPELPAETLTTNCYSYMFGNCTSLNYIKAMFTTTPSNTYTNSWVSGVASSGTFVKNAAAQWTTTGNNGIPSGWTVQTATE